MTDQAPPTSTLQRLLADQQDLYDLADRLREINTRVDGKPLPPAQILNNLNENILVPFTGSSFTQTRNTSPSMAIAVTELGFELPRTADEVTALANTLEQQAGVHPLGNFGGGLSWPIPMSQQDQTKLFSFLYVEKENPLPGLPLPVDGKGTLAYLMSGSSVDQDDLKDPVKALQKLLDSPKAIALGQALQDRMEGVPTDTGIYDYLLTAIHLGLDPESIRTPGHNKIAGFDIAQPALWGRGPSTVIDFLSQHLIGKGRATADTAKLATRLLLARTAPQFLVKDIPDGVKTSTQAWANLTIATAAIEAQRPGATANMTFAQVMAYPQNAEASSPEVEKAKNNALVDWAIANGILTKAPGNNYTPAQINTVIRTFNTQQNKRLDASAALEAEIPSRKQMALEILRERFKEEIANAKLKTPPEDFEALFEKPILTSEAPRGKYERGVVFAMNTPVDIVMMDWADRRRLKSIDPTFPVEKLNTPGRFGIPDNFDQLALNVIRKKEEATKTVIRHMISQLPLEDRKNLQFGKIEFIQEGTRRAGQKGFLAPIEAEPQLLLKVEREGKTYAYEINFNENTIKQVPPNRTIKKQSWPSKRYIGNIKVTKEFKPKTMNVDNDDITKERPAGDKIPNSFDVSRTAKISRAFVEHLQFNEDALKEIARGETPEDTIRNRGEIAKNILLDLIPFRSAISNFIQGNLGEGLSDLILDAFSFLTAGAGAAGKLMKIGKSALSATAKGLKVARVIGVTTLKELNPLSGVGDLAAGGGRLLSKGAAALIENGKYAVNTLRGATGNYDLLKAASKNNGVVATGSYKVGDEFFEAGAVLDNGKWYAYNPVTGRAYGPPLPMFNAKSIAMGGEMQKFKLLDTGLGMSEDTTKRGLRLTLDAHGAMAPGGTSALMEVNKHFITPSELLDKLKASNIDLNQYKEIRLTMCNSGSGGERSFAAQLAKLTKKPTEGFLGKMHTSTEAEDVAAMMFKNGGVKQQEFIQNNVIGTKKTIDKFKLTGLTTDNRGIYTHHPDYNPIRFDAEGKMMAPKPLRPGYTAGKITLSKESAEKNDTDLSEYDDLT